MQGAMATRIAGSSDLFGAAGRGPTASINFVTAHDGFTLADLVSYAHKHNDANGERSDEEVDRNVSIAFWTKIAQNEPTALPAKRGRGRPRKNPITV